MVLQDVCDILPYWLQCNMMRADNWIAARLICGPIRA